MKKTALTDLAPDMSSILAGFGVSQPQGKAILAPGRTPLRFAQLSAQQDYVRDRLEEWDLHRGDPVIVILPKGPEAAVAMVVLPVSATVVPADPHLSERDYEDLFERCAAKSLVLPKGQPHAARTVADRRGLLIMELDFDPEAPAGLFGLSVAAPPHGQSDRDGVGSTMAYILCTSGTTSRRKLIPHSHQNIVDYVRVMKSWLHYVPADLSIHVMPLYFAHGIEAALTVPLLNGSSVVIPESYRADSFFPLLEEYRPTWYSAGFTIHRDILHHADDYRSILANTRLRFIRSGSGRLEPHEIQALERAFKAPLVVGYGSTEAGSITCEPLPARPDKIGSVGLPVLNDVRISNGTDHVGRPGEVGEIIVRGPLVFDGYLGEPETASPLSTDGWYHTGDLGRFDADGFLYLTGRTKEVINRGGEKISPAEIDGVLEAHPAISEAAAFGFPHPTLGEIVVAAVVPVCGVDIDQRSLEDHVRAALAPTKIPAKFYIVDHLPRSGIGKLLRHKLLEVVEAG